MDNKHTDNKALLLRIDDVMATLGVGRTSIYNLLRNDPTFPKPIQLTKRCVAWKREEIEVWVRALPPTRSWRGIPTDPIAAEAH